MTVIQALKSPKNLFRRLKQVEENESCHSVFVFLVSLNLLKLLRHTKTSTHPGSFLPPILLLQGQDVPLSDVQFSCLLQKKHTNKPKKIFLFWHHFFQDRTLYFLLLYNSSTHISRHINGKVNFGKIKTKKKMRDRDKEYETKMGLT